MAEPTLLGESYGFWVQTGAIILSIFVTGYYARKAILSNGKSAKDSLSHNQQMQKIRTTIDLIIQENQDAELNSAKQTIAKLPENASFIEYLDVKDDDSDVKKQIKQSIRVLINRYEFIALGIKNDAFEEAIYKELQFSDVMEVWAKSKPMIMELRRRKGKNTYYQEFEWLADRWSNNEFKAYKNSGIVDKIVAKKWLKAL